MTLEEILDDDRGFYAAKKRMMEIMSEYLDVMDEMYETQEWTYGYLEEFLENEDWEALVRARIACAEGIGNYEELEERASSLEDLTEEEYDILFERGIDVGYQSMVLADCKELAADELRMLRQEFQTDLESQLVFAKKKRVEIRDLLGITKAKNMMLARSDCLMINYMLLTLKDTDLAQAFWEEMPTRYPTLCRNRMDWIDEEAEVLSQSQEDGDKMEELAEALYRLLSSRQAERDEAQELLEDKGGTALFRSYEALQDSPAFLPIPDWYRASRADFFYTREDGDAAHETVSGKTGTEELNEKEYRAGFCMDGVSAGQVEEYLEKAALFAKEISGNTEDGAWRIGMEDYHVDITLTDDQVTFRFEGEDITFAPAGVLGI